MASHYKDWPNAGAVSGWPVRFQAYTDRPQFNALGDTRTKVRLNVSGHFPNYAAGVLYRSGPGGYRIPRTDAKGTDAKNGDFAVSHWFDGFVTVHRFELTKDDNGSCSEVWYSSRSQVDELVEAARQTGKYQGISFGQKRDPCDTLYKKIKTAFEPTRSEQPLAVNIGVSFRAAMPAELEKAGRAPVSKRADSLFEGQSPNPPRSTTMLLTTDTSAVKTFDATSLEPLGVTNQRHLHPSLKGQLSGAHAAEDPSTGEMFNYNLAFGKVPTYKIFSANLTSGEVKVLATICEEEIKAAYIHSMFCTPNFVVLCVWNCFFKKYGISVLLNRNLMDAMDTFDPKSKATWLVIDRHHGRGVVKRFHSDAFFAFHTTNAWEEQSGSNADTIDLVCELYQFENTSILHSLYYKNLVSNETNTEAHHQKWQTNGTLTRYKLSTIPLQAPTKATGKPTYAAAEETFSIAEAGDLQQCNPLFRMKPHRYVWSVLNRGKSSFVDGLGKTDTQTGTCVVWEQARHTPSEPIFLPAPGAEAEDEGVVMTVVFDGDKGTSYLLCLDARTMVEMGRAEVEGVVGMGFHGVHVPA